MKERNYKFAIALLRFKTAYKELVEASKALPDYDVSELYPFYLLDYEKIEPAVLQWCTVHASKLMENLPDRVDNPACATCPHFRIGLGPDGICKGASLVTCFNHPAVPFSREVALPVMLAAGVNVTGLSDKDLHLLYMLRMDELYAKQPKPQS